jgi:streptogramin lyase
MTAILAGCGSGGSASAPVTTHSITGSVRGGQQPVSGSTIQLYEVGSTGYISGLAKPILTAPVSTASNGTFSITSLYSCDTGSQVYITASGGNPGLSGNNPNLTLMAALGSCSQLLANAASTFIAMDEVTTVAGAYALAQFSGNSSFGTTLASKPGVSGGSAPADNFTSSSSNALGVTNAMAIAQVLASTSTGTSPGITSSTISIPSATVNAIADILAACVNSLGLADPSNTSCETLFGEVNVPSGNNPATGQPYAAPADTLQAALYMAMNPAISTANSNALFGLITGQSPFATSLTAAPADWSLSLRIATTGLSTPYGIAIDANGDAWISNEGGTTITELSPAGSLLNTISSAGLLGPRGLSIDRNGNVWIASTGNDSVVELNSSGALTHTVTGITGPLAVANDSAGDAWVTSSVANTVVEISNSGTVLNTITGMSAPSSIAIDTSGNVWVANTGANDILELTHAGILTSTTGDGVTQAPAFVAVDPSSNVWFTGSIPLSSAVQGSVAEIASGGTAASPIVSTSVVAGGIATSGASVWIANSTASGGLLQFQSGGSTPVSPANGFGSLNTAVGVAVDPSGNVWTANSGENTVSIFLGMATPAITPLSQNVGP